MKKLLFLILLNGWAHLSLAQLAEKQILKGQLIFDATSNAYQTHNLIYANFDHNGYIDIFQANGRFVEMNISSNQETNLAVGEQGVLERYVAVLDMNNDGYDDLVKESNGELIIYLLHPSTGFTRHVFSCPGIPFPEAVLDMNGDGYPDARLNGRIYLNDGTGINFIDSGVNIGAPEFLIDWDGDGHNDLLYRNVNYGLIIRFGQGGLNYSEEFTLTSGGLGTSRPNIVDIDYDGDLDFVQAGNGIKARINNGIVVSESPQLIYSSEPDNYFGVGDYDGNGQWDAVGVNPLNGFVFIRYNYGSPDFDNRKYFGDIGAGYETETSSFFGNGLTTVTCLPDYNGDGKDDVIFVQDLTGLGKCIFTFDLAFDSSSDQTPTIIYSGHAGIGDLIDYNGDGAIDIDTGGSGMSNVLFQTPDSHLLERSEFVYKTSAPIIDKLYLDYNYDGFMDLFLCEQSGPIIYIPTVDGLLDSTNAQIFWEAGGNSIHGEDFNNDGYKDVLIELSGIPNATFYIFYSDGEGGTNNPTNPSIINWPTSSSSNSNLKFHDFDNNGKLDILRNNGDIAYQMNFGVFSYFNCPFVVNGIADVGHFDGNGFLDYIYSDYQQYYVMLNNGYSNFEQGQAIAELFGLTTSSPLFIDINGDGSDDIFASEKPIYGEDEQDLYTIIKTGDGNWEISVFDVWNANRFKVIDYDNDGDEDIICDNAGEDSESGYYYGHTAAYFWYENLSVTDYLVSGRIYYDENQNGTRDEDESTGFVFNQFSSSSGDNAFSQVDGSYSLYYDQPGLYTITASAPEGFVFTTPNEYSVDLSLSNLEVTNVDFGVYPDSAFIAGEVDLVAFNPVCDNEGAVFIQVTNTGTQNAPLTVVFDLPIGCELYQSNVSTLSVSDSTVTWFFEELEIGQSANIPFFLSYPGVDFIDSTFTYAFRAELGDSIFSDSLEMNLLCAYDPNIKVEQTGWGEQGYFLEGQTLEYIVYFQNTGNYFATNVRLEDQLSDQLISSSLEVVSSSHTMETTLDSDGLVTFYFPNIMLPDSASDPLGSIGFVKFRIDYASTVQVGEVIENFVDIFFDFNPKITTNTEINTLYDCELEGDNIPDPYIDVDPDEISAAEGYVYEWIVNGIIDTTLLTYQISWPAAGTYQVRVIDPNGCSELSEQVTILSVNEISKSAWSIYPNPTNDQFVITGIDYGSVPLIIYDIMGKKVMSINVSNGQEINVNSLSAGIYVLMINGEQQRLVVER